MRLLMSFIICFVSFAPLSAVSDTLMLKGQVSAYANCNPNNTMDLGTGSRVIPQINYELNLENNSLLDFEGSLNVYANADFQLFDSTNVDGDIKPYRLWGRYSNEQLELRFGLQKLDFGQASMLRPLMWFDRVDPRDPLGITDGVYGGLARYYFLDNTNIWLWGLYGNDEVKGMEDFATSKKTLEFGGRVQSLFVGGEVGLTYHHRQMSNAVLVENFDGSIVVPNFDEVNENRFGFDARWDFVVGAYVEGAWVTSAEDIGAYTNQKYLTLGIDYTFGVGAGLYTVVEHMMVASDYKAFNLGNTVHLTALQMNYPIGMFDNIGTIVYYDWFNNDIYSFVNWYRQYDMMTFYLMAYWNPKNADLAIPGMSTSANLMSGRGVQAMVVFNF